MCEKEKEWVKITVERERKADRQTDRQTEREKIGRSEDSFIHRATN